MDDADARLEHFLSASRNKAPLLLAQYETLDPAGSFRERPDAV